MYTMIISAEPIAPAMARTVDEVFPLIEGWTHQPGDAKWFQTK